MTEGKNKIEEYFRKQEKELVEKMQTDKTRESERREMASTLGTADADIVSALQELGYTPATVPLLYLVPLIQVAWAEESVSKHERRLILDAADLRGIKFGSMAYECLTGWLNARPMEEFFERTLSVIGALLKTLPPEQREIGKRDLVSYCAKVAEVSGGFHRIFGQPPRLHGRTGTARPHRSQVGEQSSGIGAANYKWITCAEFVRGSDSKLRIT